jgi:hypothetical protein
MFLYGDAYCNNLVVRSLLRAYWSGNHLPDCLKERVAAIFISVLKVDRGSYQRDLITDIVVAYNPICKYNERESARRGHWRELERQVRFLYAISVINLKNI